MQPELTTIEILEHPLDPRRIGPMGLVESLTSKFAAAFNDPALVQSYKAMTQELLDIRHDAGVLQTC